MGEFLYWYYAFMNIKEQGQTFSLINNLNTWSANAKKANLYHNY